MLGLIWTIVVIALANIVPASNSIIHNAEELSINSNQEIPIDQAKHIQKSFLIGGKHDVEQVDRREFEVLFLLSLLLWNFCLENEQMNFRRSLGKSDDIFHVIHLNMRCFISFQPLILLAPLLMN